MQQADIATAQHLLLLSPFSSLFFGGKFLYDYGLRYSYSDPRQWLDLKARSLKKDAAYCNQLYPMVYHNKKISRHHLYSTLFGHLSKMSRSHHCKAHLQKLNWWMHNFFEVSWHNLESSPDLMFLYGVLKPQSTYTHKVQSSVWRLPNYWPPTPSQYFKNARHWIGLLQYNPSTSQTIGKGV